MQRWTELSRDHESEEASESALLLKADCRLMLEKNTPTPAAEQSTGWERAVGKPNDPGQVAAWRKVSHQGAHLVDPMQRTPPACWVLSLILMQ